MAAEGDYIMVHKSNLIAKSGIATQTRTDMRLSLRLT